MKEWFTCLEGRMFWKLLRTEYLRIPFKRLRKMQICHITECRIALSETQKLTSLINLVTLPGQLILVGQIWNADSSDYVKQRMLMFTTLKCCCERCSDSGKLLVVFESMGMFLHNYGLLTSSLTSSRVGTRESIYTKPYKTFVDEI